MTYGSLFSGCGGADLGLDRAGMRCLWQCEIDKQAASVLKRHWPDDHTRFGHNGRELADGPRYRMIGNGVVSNCAEWIARRMMEIG